MRRRPGPHRVILDSAQGTPSAVHICKAATLFVRKSREQAHVPVQVAFLGHCTVVLGGKN
jgi:hypothetical protein